MWDCRISQDISEIEISPMPKKTSLPKARQSINSKAEKYQLSTYDYVIFFEVAKRLISSPFNSISPNKYK